MNEATTCLTRAGTSVGLGVSILSYGGGVQFGVIADVALCPDPQAIIDQFEPEFERLARTMGQRNARKSVAV